MNDKSKRRFFAIGALIVATGALGFLAVGGIGENLVYYWSPSELIEAGAKAENSTVRLGGLVVAGSIQYASDGRSLDFRVTDGEQQVAVHANAVPPAMFREGIGVVVEGAMTSSGQFETQRLMVKHDNEYRAPEDADGRTMEDLMATMQFAEGSAE